MLDLEANRGLRWLFHIARLRVPAGFLIAAATLWLAQPSRESLWLGGAVAAAGEGLRVWASGHLRKGQEVTHSGPYRYMGHPLYVGSLIIGFGFALAVGHSVAAGLVVTYLAVTLFAAVRLEEATLRDEFATEFDAYAAGHVARSERRFSLDQLVTNGEHKALVGFAAMLALLWLKAWLFAS